MLMSLRTRRGLAFTVSLLLLVLACSPATGPTAAPTGAATPVPTGAATPAPTGGETPAPTAGETPAVTDAPSPGTADQVLRQYLSATDPRSLQPQAASGSDEIAVLGPIQRGLLYRDFEGNLIPSLATDLGTVSEDGLTYTFTLRDDAAYSNGTPIVAGDIVRAARILADPRNAFDYGYEACYIVGANALLGTDFGCPEGDTPYSNPETGEFDDATIDGLLEELGVTAPDDHTVVFQLTQPTSFWRDILAMWLFTPVAPEQGDYAEAANIIASGPFMLSEWTHNSQMVLTPNPGWYGEAPKLERIELSIGGDPAAALAAFERGDLDMVGVPSAEIRRVLATPEYESMINRSSTLSIEYWDFANCLAEDSAGNILCPPNTGTEDGMSPSANKNFRAALTQAIDKTELINVTFAGIGVAAYSPTMPGIPDFPTVTAETSPYAFDPAAALASMATALDELGVGEPDPATVLPADDTCDDACQAIKARVKLLGPLKFGYNCDAGHDQRVLYVAQKWREVLGFSGSQMDIRCTDFGTFRTERRAGNIYDIARNGWGADFPHPDNQNRDLFACGAGNNNSKYCNPAYDDLLNQGAQAATYEEAVPFYHQAEELLVQDAPVFFMRYGEGVRLIQPYVTGIHQTPNDHQNVGDVFYETIEIAAH